MPKPKNFSPANAEQGNFKLAANDHVYVYRYGNWDESNNWSSRRRSKNNGNGFPKPSDGDLNDWALKQSSYGSESEGIENNPFISVATSFDVLKNKGDVWVQKIVETAPHIGEFKVPYSSLFRPSPTKLISKEETEWLYFDGEKKIKENECQKRSNPYLKK